MNQDRSDTPADARRAIAAYYRQTQWQYYGLWSGRGTLALHYGYWDDGVRSHAQSLARLNAVLAERADIGRGDRVLDAGSGWGGSSIWLARDRGARCTGVTLEPHQVRIARMMAARRGVSDLTEFALGDYTRLPFADASFDVVWAVESVCHATDKSAFLREAARVLRPSGRLIVSDFFRAEAAMGADREALLRAWVSQWVVPDLASLDGFGADARRAGFDEVVTDDVTDRIRPAARRLYRTGLLTAPLAGLFRLLRLHNDYHHANWLSSLRQYRALQAGAWRYGIVTARRSDA
ncbi:SAM-dependent methyltransferase [Spectribacter hydrogenooxidans]|uniref:Methyltransferase domain-containing protein n=1 Tax=Spectribacter hydrogenoxidans TaxID=3075608 RepID=A0ABU3C2T7_9GAMM|nr:methyltransferase domain-containing protein [Salinisphaera sp. W335]MDT0635873.1 methyltransferase domain-containing protein [Salinisphaera sp. W335]